MQALALLHRLSSAPETAGDALKLLHELQVHQVELDLQHEEAEQDRLRLTEELANYALLFDVAPFAYLTLFPEGLVIAANRIAAEWLALETAQKDDWAGRRIGDLLAPECRVAVRHALAALRSWDGRQTCTVQPLVGGDSAHALATFARVGAQVLMAFLPAGPAPRH